MSYMPCDINWEKKDFTALAKRLSYAAEACQEVTDNEDLENYKRLVAIHCKIYIDKYEASRKDNPL